MEVFMRTASLRLDAGELITLPHFSISTAMNFQIPQASSGMGSAKSANLVLSFGSARRLVDLLVEPVNDFGRRIFRRADSEPDGRLEARQEF